MSKGDGRGGFRVNGGRKPGSLDFKAKNNAMLEEIRLRYKEQFGEDIRKLVPLEVMTIDMWMKAEAGEWSAAADRASMIAPYIHAKIPPPPANSLHVETITTTSTVIERASSVFGRAITVQPTISVDDASD